MLRYTLTITVLLLMAIPAMAQTIDTIFPDPLSWPILRERLQAIQPSEAQLKLVASEHDAYLRGWEEFHEEDIADFLIETKGFGAMTSDDPDEARRHLARTAAIRRHLSALDEDLFGRLEALLSESQRAGLNAIGQWRARSRLRSRSMPALSGLTIPDIELRPAVPWADLDEPSQRSIEAMLEDWEARQTKLLEAWATATDRASLAFIEQIAQLNAAQSDFSPENPPSQEVIAELINTFRAAQQQNAASIQPSIDQLQRHALSGIESLATHLPPQYQFQAVREITPPAGGNRIDAAIQSARRQGLDASTLLDMEIIADQWRNEAIPIMIGMLRAQWLDQQKMMQGMMASSEDGTLSIPMPDQSETMEARTQWREAHDRTLESILAMAPDRGSLENEISNEDVIEAQTFESSTTIIMSSGSEEESDGATVVVSSTISNDTSMPPHMKHAGRLPPITPQMLNAIARDLELDQTERMALDRLHQAHDTARDRMEAARLDERNAKREALQTQMESSEDRNPAVMMEVARLMTEPISREGLESLDQAFFDGIDGMTGEDPRLSPWRLARTRARSVGGGMMSGSMDLVGMPDRRWKVDLLMTVEEIDVNDEDRASLRSIILDWHAPATTSLLDIHETADRLEDAMNLMVQASQKDGGMNIDLAAAMKLQSLQEELASKQTSLALLNQEFANAAIAELQDGTAFERQWQMDAFPIIAGDPDFLPLYEKAANVDGLTDDQRAAIAMLKAEHDEAWWSSTQKAISKVIGDTLDSADAEEAFFQSQQARQEVDRIAFARREAALKRLEKLREILNSAQLVMLNHLPDPETAPTERLPF